MAYAVAAVFKPCTLVAALAAVVVVPKEVDAKATRTQAKPGRAKIEADAVDAVWCIWPADVSAGTAIGRVGLQEHAIAVAVDRAPGAVVHARSGNTRAH